MNVKTLLRVGFLGAILTALCVISASAACVGVGTVNTDGGLRLRAEGSRDAKILATVPQNTRVVVLEESVNGWYKVDCNTVEGYMSAVYLDVVTEQNVNLGWGVTSVEGSVLNLREDATTGAKILARIPDGTPVKVSGVKDGWYKITYSGKEGYVSSDYLILTLDKNGTRRDGNSVDVVIEDTSVPLTAAPTPQQARACVDESVNTVVEAGSDLGARAVAIAKQYLGCPYRSGGKGPNSFDCSGFVQYVYKQLGYNLPAGSTTQWKTIVGQRIYSMSEMQPGDLFFICHPAFSGGRATSHVGIYIGGGQFIHAATTGYKVIISGINEAPYGPYFVGAIRLG